MKTKKLFLMAAMLLMSANIFAQNIVKGDVNEDGNVDVADVVAVISIMQQGGGVAILPSSVEFDKSEYGVGIDKELKLKATVLPSYATDKSLTWTSSNPGVATVSQEGVVKGISEGSTTITVSTANGKQTTCVVNVSAVVYYWYVGTTKPTSLEYEGVEMVSSYESEVIYINNSGAKSHIFVLTNTDKNVKFEDPNTHGTVTQKPVDTTTIPGYNIFETSIGLANTKDIIIKIYDI